MSRQPPHVCSFESRRQHEMATLIQKFGGLATVAPSMQEVPLSSQPDVFSFASRLAQEAIDITIFMTGVGTDSLFAALAQQISEDALADQIRKTFVAARGPKPTAALAKRKITPDLRAPEPNTWRELVNEFNSNAVPLQERRIAIQEYGIPNDELYDWLREQGAEVIPVSIYRWELPDNLDPLKAAITNTIAGQFDLLLWTSAQQVVHVVDVAKQMGLHAEWLSAAKQCANASIGPTASLRLREYGLEPTLEPSHPKMAHLVREAIASINR